LCSKGTTCRHMPDVAYLEVIWELLEFENTQNSSSTTLDE